MASQQLPAKVEASTLEKLPEIGGQLLASGSAYINPRVENRVHLSFELLKKPCGPSTNVVLKVTAGENGTTIYENLNAIIEAMPVNKKETVKVDLVFAPNPLATGNKLTYELRDTIPLPSDYLQCYGSCVKVVPTPSN